MPLGLLAGVILPWAAKPFSQAIPLFIGLLLFLSVLRLLSVSRELNGQSSCSKPGTTTTVFAQADYIALLLRVLLAQLLLPLGVYALGMYFGLPWQWCLAFTLVAAAPPISGSPNLVQLLRGDDELTLRWLIVGTALLPLTCLPLMYLLFTFENSLLLLKPSLKLLALIGGAVLAAYGVATLFHKQQLALSSQALDGAGSITLALMVIGLMSALHQPGHSGLIVVLTLCAAFGINAGLQLVGIASGRLMRHSKSRVIASGVVLGNRNVALYLAALPASMTEPLLLFIACYQIPMYLTPLLGGLLYKRLAD